MSRISAPNAYMRRARQALASSQILAKQGDTKGAHNRAYYAMFYAAHVALQAVSTIEAAAIYKTHRGLIGRSAES